MDKEVAIKEWVKESVKKIQEEENRRELELRETLARLLSFYSGYKREDE